MTLAAVVTTVDGRPIFCPRQCRRCSCRVAGHARAGPGRRKMWRLANWSFWRSTKTVELGLDRGRCEQDPSTGDGPVRSSGRAEPAPRTCPCRRKQNWKGETTVKPSRRANPNGIFKGRGREWGNHKVNLPLKPPRKRWARSTACITARVVVFFVADWYRIGRKKSAGRITTFLSSAC